MRLANRSSRRAITLANPGEVGEGALIVHPLSRLGLQASPSPRGESEIRALSDSHARAQPFDARLTAKWGEIESATTRAIHTGGRRCAHGATASKKAATPCILAS
jgi:hypothetical protein